MNDLKEFLQDLRPKFICDNYDNRLFNNIQEELGLFFWERGGKKLCKMFIWENAIYHKSRHNFDYLFNLTKECWSSSNAQDFLDCLACLGEERVKELIKELECEKK